jgi:hypothetical protein
MDITTCIEAIRSQILELDELVGKQLPALQPSEVCDFLVQIHRLKDELSLVYASASHIASESLGDQSELLLSDGSRIEKKMSSDRKAWRHKEIASVVAKRLSSLSIDMDTGERVMSMEEVAERVLDYVQPSYWRIKQLSELGINADDYCDVGETKTSIIVRKAK